MVGIFKLLAQVLFMLCQLPGIDSGFLHFGSQKADFLVLVFGFPCQGTGGFFRLVKLAGQFTGGFPGTAYFLCEPFDFLLCFGGAVLGFLKVPVQAAHFADLLLLFMQFGQPVVQGFKSADGVG